MWLGKLQAKKKRLLFYEDWKIASCFGRKILLEDNLIWHDVTGHDVKSNIYFGKLGNKKVTNKTLVRMNMEKLRRNYL